MGKPMDRLTRPTRASRSPISRNMSNNYLYPKSPDSLPQSKTFSSHNNESYELSDTNVSFHPTINPKSRQIDRHISRSPMNRSYNRFDRLYMIKGKSFVINFAFRPELSQTGSPQKLIRQRKPAKRHRNLHFQTRNNQIR